MSDHSGSADGNDEISFEDEPGQQIEDDYSSNKGIEEEQGPKITSNEKKILIEQVK